MDISLLSDSELKDLLNQITEERQRRTKDCVKKNYAFTPEMEEDWAKRFTWEALCKRPDLKDYIDKHIAPLREIRERFIELCDYVTGNYNVDKKKETYISASIYRGKHIIEPELNETYRAMWTDLVGVVDKYMKLKELPKEDQK